MDANEVIKNHGGAASLARKLGFTYKGGTQRVFNWGKRGIPYKIIVLYGHILFNL